MNSYELLVALKENEKIAVKDFWWPNAGSFEVAVGAMLTQQSKWEKVEKSLQNLKAHDALDVQKIAQTDEIILQELILPSGLYRQKAKNLKLFCINLMNDFGNFETFSCEVQREWLLAQKGIGEESADAILNYACKKDFFVVDSYTNRLLSFYGYEFESYDEINEWITQGVLENFDKIQTLYKRDISLAEVFARLHGKIVEFCKKNVKGKMVLRGIKGLETP